MYSIAELVDKLIIENIKIFRLRESLHNEKLNDEDFVLNKNKMNVINENRGVIINFLNKKIENVIDKTDKNSYFNDVKTYKK